LAVFLAVQWPNLDDTMRNGAWNACDLFNGFIQTGRDVSDRLAAEWV